MNNLHAWSIVAVAAFVTALIRFLPFLVFGGERKVPKVIEKFGKVLPYAVMSMLVIYCLKGVSFTSISGFLPSLVACLVVGGLHVWKRNTLLSIIAGTLCYMIMVQTMI